MQKSATSNFKASPQGSKALSGMAAVAAISLSGCITTSMRGYADRELPAKPVSRMVAYVAGPGSLASGPAVRMIKFTE